MTNMNGMTKCLRTVLWRNEPFQMHEYCALKESGQETHFEGVMVAAVDEKPLSIAYHVICDREGLTRSVTVDAVGSLGEHRHRLIADDQRTWSWNGRALADCKGFSDVDLGFSPATNSLPIRRLGLTIGESRTITVVWLRFPEFDVVPFPQRYTRLAPDRYLFESLLSNFKAELVVDELGLVRKYGQYWEAVATGQEC